MECRQEQCGVEPAQTGAYERSLDDDSGLALIIGTSIAIINTFTIRDPRQDTYYWYMQLFLHKEATFIMVLDDYSENKVTGSMHAYNEFTLTVKLVLFPLSSIVY